MAQWSQGLPLGSTEHCFSFSKNSTNSDTAASSTPNLSWLGCSAEYGERADCGLVSKFDRANGASQGDWANFGTNVRAGSEAIDLSAGGVLIEGRTVAGGVAETKLITRARGFSEGPCATPLRVEGGSLTVDSPAKRRE